MPELIDVPIGSSSDPSGLDRIPSGALQFMFFPIASFSIGAPFCAQCLGASTSIGMSDMERRHGHGCGIGLDGVFSPRGDNSANAWHDQVSGSPSGTVVNQRGAGEVAVRVGDAVAGDCDSSVTNVNASRELPTLFMRNGIDVHVDRVDLRTSPGTQAITGVGFQPQLVLFLGVHPREGTGSGNNTKFGASYSFGAADSDGQQWSTAMRSYYNSGCTNLGFHVGYGKRSSRFRIDACVQHIGETQYFAHASTSNHTAALDSFDADGFTLDFSEAAADGSGRPHKLAYMAFRADPGLGRFACGHGIQGDTGISTTFDPDAFFFVSNGATDTGLQTYCGFTTGMSCDGEERGGWIYGRSGFNFGTCANRTGGATAIEWSTSFSLFTLGGQAHCILQPGGCELQWNTDDGLPRYFGWVAFKTVSVPEPGCEEGVISAPITHSLANNPAWAG